MAVKDVYTDYNAKQYDYALRYDLLSATPEFNPHVIDSARLDFDPQDELPAWHLKSPLQNISGMTFRYQLHKTSNVNDRSDIYYGSVDVAADVRLWGLPTHQEFRAHLAIGDKTLARDIWEELKCEFAGTGTKFVFWLAKLHTGYTQPGCWAITIQAQDGRNIVIFANGELHHFGPFRLTKQNTVRFHK